MVKIHNWYQTLGQLLTEVKLGLEQGQLDSQIWHNAQLLWEEQILAIADDPHHPQHQRYKTELYRSWRLLKTAFMFAQMNKTPEKWEQVTHHLTQVIGYCESMTP